MKRKILLISLFSLYFFLVYNINFRGPDEPIYFAYTASVVEDGDLNIINRVGELDEWAMYVTQTYNWPNLHTHGGVTLWIPFYGYARFVYSAAETLGLGSFTRHGFTRAARGALSLGTVLLGLTVILLSVKLCGLFVSGSSIWYAAVFIFLGTPFFYYMLHDTGNANMPAAMLFSVLLLWTYHMADMKKLHWLLYGMFFSVCVAVRVEMWLAVIFILAFFVYLLLKKQIRVKSLLFFSAGFIPVFLLRAANAYIKFGSFHMEELLALDTSARFFSPFDGLFAPYRSVFYTSPVLFLCVLGIILLVLDLLRTGKKENGPEKVFLIFLSLYLIVKLVAVRGAFGFGLDILAPRWILMEYPVFVILFAYTMGRCGKAARVPIIIISAAAVLWNFMVISEVMMGVDWAEVVFRPGIFERVGRIRYAAGIFTNFNNLGLKFKFFLPVLLLCIWLLKVIIKVWPEGNAKLLDDSSGKQTSCLKLFSGITVYLVLTYFAVTLLNVCNNRRNVESLMEEGFFKDMFIVDASPLKVNEFTENYSHIYALAELKRYYAIKGEREKVENIIKFRDKKKTDGFYTYPGTQFSMCARDNLIDEFSESGRYDKAVRLYRDILEVHPEIPDPYLGLSDLYILTGKYSFAEDILKKASERFPENTAVFLRLGKIYEKTGRYDLAVEKHRKVLEIEPGRTRPRVSVWEKHIERGEYDKALEIIRGKAKLRPYNARVMSELGRIYQEMNEYEKAEIYYKYSIELNPGVPENYTRLGNLYLKKGDSGKAQEYFIRAADISPRSGIYRSLVDVFQGAGEYEKALDVLNQSLELNPRDAEAYMRMGEIYRGMGNYEKAAERYEEALKIRPGHPDIYINLGEIYAGKGEYEKAGEYLTRAADIAPRPGTFRSLAEVFRKMGELERAREYLEKVLDITPGHPEIYMSMGEIYRSMGNYEKAAEYLIRAADISPRSGIYRSLANLFRGIGEFEKALEYLEKIPRDADTLMSAGGIYRDMGNYEKAAEKYKEALKLRPGIIDSYIKLGDIYAGRGEYGKAKEYLKRAADIAPLPGVYRSLANAYQNIGEFEKALKFLEKALEFSPGDTDTLMGMGDIYRGRGDYGTAARFYEKVLEKRPEYHPGYINLGGVYKDMGEYDKALVLLRQALKIKATFDTYMRMGELYENTAAHKKAAEYYGKAFRLRPASADANLRLGLVYSRLSKHSKATEYFERAVELDKNIPHAFMEVAAIHRKNHNFEKSVHYLKKAIEYAPGFSDPLRELGYVHSRMRKYDEALAYFERFLEVDEKDPDAHYHIGRVYLLMGKKEDAVEKAEILRSMGSPGLADALENMIRLHSTYQSILGNYLFHLLKTFSVYFIRFLRFPYIL